MFLSSSAHLKFGHPIEGHLEVCGVPSSNKDTDWYAAEGVYLPRTDTKKGKAAKDKDAKDKDKDKL